MPDRKQPAGRTRTEQADHARGILVAKTEAEKKAKRKDKMDSLIHVWNTDVAIRAGDTIVAAKGEPQTKAQNMHKNRWALEGWICSCINC